MHQQVHLRTSIWRLCDRLVRSSCFVPTPTIQDMLDSARPQMPLLMFSCTCNLHRASSPFALCPCSTRVTGSGAALWHCALLCTCHRPWGAAPLVAQIQTQPQTPALPHVYAQAILYLRFQTLDYTLVFMTALG